jgi:hypothetical protein
MHSFIRKGEMCAMLIKKAFDHQLASDKEFSTDLYPSSKVQISSPICNEKVVQAEFRLAAKV